MLTMLMKEARFILLYPFVGCFGLGNVLCVCVHNADPMQVYYVVCMKNIEELLFSVTSEFCSYVW